MSDGTALLPLFAVGAGTGVLATLLGIGGGVVVVPVLTQIYGFPPALAAGTSICCVFLNCVSGSAVYLRQRRIDIPLGLAFGAATLPGAALGVWLVQRVQSATFDLLFGALMAAVGALLVAKRPGGPGTDRDAPEPLLRTGRARSITDAGGRTFAYRVSWALGLAMSAAAGVLAAFFGVGGGFLHVPFLHRVFGMAIHAATATSLFILTFTSLGSAAGQMALRQARYDYVAAIGAGLVLGAQLGARLAPRAKPRVLAALVAVALAGVGARMIWRGITG